jgi:hypothetical protein
MVKKIFFILLAIILLIGIFELVYSKFLYVDIWTKFANHTSLSKYYSKEEMDLTLKYRHENHGNNCIEHGYTKENMRWHPRYGGFDKNIDIDCINNLFSKNTTNVIFFGGSVMANGQTPNYLTSIEYYLFKDNLNNFRTVNFAESSARMSNNLSMFIEYIPKINNVDYVIFLDGVNEFHSIKFNGEYDDDFYWTAGVKHRIHNPQYFLLDKILEKSVLLKNIAIQFLNYQSNRNPNNLKISDELIKKSADDYIYRKKIVKKLCNIYSLNCIFFLQPSFYISKEMSGNKIEFINNYFEKYFPDNEYIYSLGYKYLREDQDLIDISSSFDGKENIYLDDTHFDKFGSEIIADYLKKYIK